MKQGPIFRIGQNIAETAPIGAMVGGQATDGRGLGLRGCVGGLWGLTPHAIPQLTL